METRSSLSGLGQFLGALCLIGALLLVGSRYGGPLLAGLRDFAKPVQTNAQPAPALAPRVNAQPAIRPPVQQIRRENGLEVLPRAPSNTIDTGEPSVQAAEEQQPAPDIEREVLSIQQQPADGSAPPIEVRRVIITTTGGGETIVSDRGSKRKSGKP